MTPTTITTQIADSAHAESTFNNSSPNGFAEAGFCPVNKLPDLTTFAYNSLKHGFTTTSGRCTYPPRLWCFGIAATELDNLALKQEWDILTPITLF